MIRKIRRDRDITQRELSEALCVERSTIAKWETGKSKPSPEMYQRIAAVLDCTVDELLKGENKKPAENQQTLS